MSQDLAPTAETMKQACDRRWMEYGRMMASMWKEGKLTDESFAKIKSFRDCVKCVFDVMVSQGIIDKLEQQEAHVKGQLKELAAKYKNDMSVDDRVVFCKAILAMEVLLS